MVANMVLVGAAYQSGSLPLSLDALQEAIRLNDTGVEVNLAAFHWGRVAVAMPSKIPSLRSHVDKELLARSDRAAEMLTGIKLSETLMDVLRVRIADLIAFQSASYAQSYLDKVKFAIERSRTTSLDESSLVAFAKYLYKLMAYKDEYEVARLHLEASSRAGIENQFGADTKVYWNLHPPVLRAMGLKHKIKLGPWFAPVFHGLTAMRHVRGTRLDFFGWAHVRRVERALVVQYSKVMAEAFERATASNVDLLLALAESPELIRGYEGIKLNNVVPYLAEVRNLCSQLNINPCIDDVLLGLDNEVSLGMSNVNS